MEQNLPDFDTPAAPADAPKKSRRKPSRERAAKKASMKLAAPKRVAKKRNVRRTKPVKMSIFADSRPKEFEVVQGLIKTMLLLDKATAKSVANLLAAIFA